MLTEIEYKEITKENVRWLMENMTETALQKVDQAFLLKLVPEEWHKDSNYLLAKAVIDSLCRDRPHSFDRVSHYQKEFDNLHIQL